MFRFCSCVIRFDRICELAEQRSQYSKAKALVKAMLTSPTQDANGYSNTFGTQDFNSLRAYGSSRAQATEAAEWMLSADEFIQAYCNRIGAADATKVMNKFEVRCPMFVHSKKHETRASFSSLVDIAADLYRELKLLDPKIPKWSKLPDDALTSLKQETSSHKQVLLRETGDDIGENLLAEKGYSLNGHITEVATGHIYMISSFSADEVSASLKLVKPAAETKSKKSNKIPQKLTVQRIELLQCIKWHPIDCTEPKFLDPRKIVIFQNNLEFKAYIIIGEIKAKLAIEANKGNDTDMRLQTFPGISVVSNKQFNKGAMKLVAISNSISVVQDGKSFIMGSKSYTLYSGNSFKISMKSSNDSLASKSSQEQYLCAMFWHTTSVFDPGCANSELSEKEVVISVLGEKMTIKIPMIINKEPLKVGDHIKLLKKSESIEEPPNKKFKFTLPASKK